MKAVYALPFYAGLTAAFASYHSGAGMLGAIVVGFLAGAATLLIGQLAFASMPSPLIRGAIALVFAVPAAVAGFYMTLGLSRIGVSFPVWSDIFAVVGAICVGGTAFARRAAMAGGPPGGQRTMLSDPSYSMDLRNRVVAAVKSRQARLQSPSLLSRRAAGASLAASSIRRPIAADFSCRNGDLKDQASPQDDRCLPQPCVGRQLLDSEPSNIGASYLAAVDACEVGDGPDAATSLVIGEPCRPDNDPIE